MMVRNIVAVVVHLIVTYVSVLYFGDLFVVFSFFFFKQKTAYEMRISDWSSDVCSSDLCRDDRSADAWPRRARLSRPGAGYIGGCAPAAGGDRRYGHRRARREWSARRAAAGRCGRIGGTGDRPVSRAFARARDRADRKHRHRPSGDRNIRGSAGARRRPAVLGRHRRGPGGGPADIWRRFRRRRLGPDFLVVSCRRPEEHTSVLHSLMCISYFV